MLQVPWLCYLPSEKINSCTENLYSNRYWDDWRMYFNLCDHHIIPLSITTKAYCFQSLKSQSYLSSFSCMELQFFNPSHDPVKSSDALFFFFFLHLSTYFRIDKYLKEKGRTSPGFYCSCDLVTSCLHCLLNFNQMILIYSFSNTDFFRVVLTGTVVLRKVILQKQKFCGSYLYKLCL